MQSGRTEAHRLVELVLLPPDEQVRSQDLRALLKRDGEEEEREGVPSLREAEDTRVDCVARALEAGRTRGANGNAPAPETEPVARSSSCMSALAFGWSSFFFLPSLPLSSTAASSFSSFSSVFSSTSPPNSSIN